MRDSITPSVRYSRPVWRIVGTLLTAWLVILANAGQVCAQDNTLTFDDLVRSAEQWAKDNLDEDALRVLQNNTDRQKVEQLLADIQKQFQGEYVIDLASLKDAARTLLPLLEKYEETLPYALWLRTRLDYL